MSPTIAKVLWQLQWWIVLAILVFATVAFGGVHPPSIFFIRLLLILSIFVQILLLFLEKYYFHDFSSSIRVAACFFTSFLIFVSAQRWFGLKVLEGSILGSVNVQATYELLLQLVFYFLFFFICVKLAAGRDFVDRFGSSLAVLTFFITLLGLAQRLITDKPILWKHFLPIHSAFFGPFLNENHFGGFLGLTFPLALALMHYRFNKVRRQWAIFPFIFPPGLRPERARGAGGGGWKRWMALMDSGVVFLFLLIIFTLGGCFFSGARVASVVLLVSCVAYFAVYGIVRRNVWSYLVLLAILVGLFLFLWWIGFQPIAKGFELDEFKQFLAMRFNVAWQSLNLLSTYPIFGTGLGTYQYVSSKVVSELADQVTWNHAHNDYVELLVETGPIGFCLFFSGMLILLFFSIRKMSETSSMWNRVLGVQALIAIFSIGVMELFDYHLRTPAIAFLFVLQLAILSQSGRGHRFFPPLTLPSPPPPQGRRIRPLAEKGERVKGEGEIRRPSAWISVFSGIILCFLLLNASLKDYRAYALSQASGDRIRNLEKALKLQPSNAKFWYLLGSERVKELRNLRRTTNEILESEEVEEAISALRKAAALSPTYAFYWYVLGLAEYEFGFEEAGVKSLEKAAYWAPARPKYLVMLLRAYVQEIDQVRPWQERVELLAKTKDLYERLEHLPHVPREHQFREWMGGRYDRLLELISQ